MINKNGIRSELKILKFIDEFIKKNNFAPSFVELGEGIDLTPSGAAIGVKRLIKKGYIEQIKHSRRGFRLTVSALELITNEISISPHVKSNEAPKVNADDARISRHIVPLPALPFKIGPAFTAEDEKKLLQEYNAGKTGDPLALLRTRFLMAVTDRNYGAMTVYLQNDWPREQEIYKETALALAFDIARAGGDRVGEKLLKGYTETKPPAPKAREKVKVPVVRKSRRNGASDGT